MFSSVTTLATCCTLVLPALSCCCWTRYFGAYVSKQHHSFQRRQKHHFLIMCDVLVRDAKTGSLRKSFQKHICLHRAVSLPGFLQITNRIGVMRYAVLLSMGRPGHQNQPRPRHLPAQVQSLYLTCLSIRSPSSVCSYWRLFIQSTLNTVAVLLGWELPHGAVIAVKLFVCVYFSPYELKKVD